MIQKSPTLLCPTMNSLAIRKHPSSHTAFAGCRSGVLPAHAVRGYYCDQKRRPGMNISFRRYIHAELLMAMLLFATVVACDGSMSSLDQAALDGDVVRVKALIAEGADVNAAD